MLQHSQSRWTCWQNVALNIYECASEGLVRYQNGNVRTSSRFDQVCWWDQVKAGTLPFRTDVSNACDDSLYVFSRFKWSVSSNVHFDLKDVYKPYGQDIGHCKSTKCFNEGPSSISPSRHGTLLGQDMMPLASHLTLIIAVGLNSTSNKKECMVQRIGRSHWEVSRRPKLVLSTIAQPCVFDKHDDFSAAAASCDCQEYLPHWLVVSIAHARHGLATKVDLDFTIIKQDWALAQVLRAPDAEALVEVLSHQGHD